MPKYEIDAIRSLVSAAQANAGGVGQIADGLPKNLDDTAFGGMAASRELSTGVGGFIGSMSEQFSRGEMLLNEAARALDRIAQRLEDQEHEYGAAVTPREGAR
ncbi:hypothetical protein [Amycolatopsis arida]|uniref:hypothetical protein n=1 Tax=Amycolatopsis arida TaxID=587909 RepID=UPI0010667F49|nr:hypothetical protein [Amycolatopsis arida]